MSLRNPVAPKVFKPRIRLLVVALLAGNIGVLLSSSSWPQNRLLFFLLFMNVSLILSWKYYVRFGTVEILADTIVGPHWLLPTKVSIALDRIDRQKTRERTWLTKLVRYTDVWSNDGERIRLDHDGFGKDQVLEILRQLQCLGP